MRLDLFDLELGLLQSATHIELFVNTAAFRNLPDNLVPTMLGKYLDPESPASAQRALQLLFDLRCGHTCTINTFGFLGSHLQGLLLAELG